MSESLVTRLELIAAKAKQLANDYRNGKLWEGQLERGLGELLEQLILAKQEARQ